MNNRLSEFVKALALDHRIKCKRWENGMALDKWKTEGGQGGRLGHSNMNHWDYTEYIKAACRKVRRKQGNEIIRRELDEYKTEKFADSD